MTPNPVPSREAVEEWTNILEGKGLLVPANMLRDLLAAVERLTKIANINAISCTATHQENERLRGEVERLQSTAGMRAMVAQRKSLEATVAAQAADVARYRWWQENWHILAEEEGGITGVAYSCQIDVVSGKYTDAQLMDMVADGYIAGEKDAALASQPRLNAAAAKK